MTRIHFVIVFFLSIAPFGVADDAAAPKPITEEEAREFCETFAEKFLAGDGPWLEEHINIAGMVWNATDNAQDEISKGFRRGALAKVNGQTPTVREFASMKQQFEDYRFRHVRKDGDTWKGLFRLSLVGGAVNYHELDLVRKANGKVGVSELYVFVTGETLTETFRRLFRDMKQKAQKDPGAKSWTVAYDTLEKMREALKAGRHQQVLELFETLPEDFQKDKVVAVIRVQAAANLDEAVYEQVLNEYEETFPNDPSLDLMCLDGYFISKDYDRCRESLDRLNARLGGDGHMALLKATTYFLEGKFAETVAAARAGIKDEEDFKGLYDVLLNTSLKLKDHRLTKEMLETLETKFDVTFADLTQVEEYRDFVKTAEFAAWRKAQEDEPSAPEF